ncbi:MAG TPA: DoxX family membrane protein [Terriglobales bacterium]|nr:DoxX family membrane protein [Terriglobales bacterium]
MAGGARSRRQADVWRSLFRIGVGVYWLYFASQKWPAPLGVGPTHGIDWMHPLIVRAAAVNPVGFLQTLLTQLVVPNWQVFAVLQATGETVAGVLLILGIATRPAALLATLLALNLSLTVAFTDSDVGLRWLYYLPVLASFEVFVNGSGSLAVDRARWVPGWLRS